MAETLQNMVGYYLGITPDAATVPTTTMIEQWLKDGSTYVMKYAQLARLAEKHVKESLPFTTGVLTLPATFMRVVAWYDDTHNPHKLVSVAYGEYVLSNANEYLDETIDKIFWIIGASAYNGVTGSSASGNLIYIAEPADSADVPSDLHEIVIKYAVAQAKFEAQEFEEGMVLMNEVRIELGMGQQ